MNLVAALIMLGPMGDGSVLLKDRFAKVFGILAGLTGAATLIQVNHALEFEHSNSYPILGTRIPREDDTTVIAAP